MIAVLALVLRLTAILVWMGQLAPGRDPHEYSALASAIAYEADDIPQAAVLTAVAFREGSLRLDAVGDHGRSHCALQVNLPGGQRTLEGWTGAELRADATKCVTAGARILRDSMRWCPAFPIAVYAAGRDGCSSKRAQRISNDRIALARGLVSSLEVQP